MDTGMFRKIDYARLAEQRKVLAEIQQHIQMTDGFNGNGFFETKDVDALDGILNLTYCLAEWAVDHGIATEETAFPSKEK